MYTCVVVTYRAELGEMAIAAREREASSMARILGLVNKSMNAEKITPLLVGLAAGSTIALMFSAIPFAETNFTLDPTEL